MSRVLVTGCAGFIGSHLCDRLLSDGHSVIGVDVFTDYYDVAQKWSNIAGAMADTRFELLEADINETDLDILDGIDVIYHQAGQPGVRSSWRDQFNDYLDRNVLATQRLLEGAVQRSVARFVYASSSSLYGNADRYPVDERMRPQPFSPYGVTKLAGEHLCSLYGTNFGLSTVSLRYFTVYGPRQRPDMAAHRLFEAALNGATFPLFGSGEQLRDFTYVGDVVAANLCAAEADVEPGVVANVAGGGECSMNELIGLVEEITGRSIEVDRQDTERGDVQRTGALTEVARLTLGWRPRFSLRDGLEQQHLWHLGRR